MSAALHASIVPELLPLTADDGRTVHVKLEALQPTGSFKIRGALRFVSRIKREGVLKSVWTASAGNTGSALAYAARLHDVPCTVVVPDHIPECKAQRIREYGATLVPVPFDQCWQAVVSEAHPNVDGAFLHSVASDDMLAGNGEIAEEVISHLPTTATLMTPWGGGGLTCGSALALRRIDAKVRVVAVEVETATPLRSSLRAGRPVLVPHEHSFVDGIGSSSVLEAMWPLACGLVDEVVVVTLDEVRDAMRRIEHSAGVRLEGAGAAAVAAALRTPHGADQNSGHTVCIATGKNIDPPAFDEETRRREQIA